MTHVRIPRLGMMDMEVTAIFMPQTKSFATRILGITTAQIIIVAPVVTLVNIDNKMAIVRL